MYILNIKHDLRELAPAQNPLAAPIELSMNIFEPTSDQWCGTTVQKPLAPAQKLCTTVQPEGIW